MQDQALTARDMMTTRLKTVRADDRVYDAVRMLLDNGISGAPVVDENRNLIGILSEKDCTQALMRAVVHGLPSSLVKDVMTTHVVSVPPDAHLLTVSHIFLNRPIRRIPVVEDGKLVGQISRRDLLKHAVSVFDTAPDRTAAVLYLSAIDGRKLPT